MSEEEIALIEYFSTEFETVNSLEMERFIDGFRAGKKAGTEIIYKNYYDEYIKNQEDLYKYIKLKEKLEQRFKKCKIMGVTYFRSAIKQVFE